LVRKLSNPWSKLEDLAEQFRNGDLRNPDLRFNIGFLRGGEIKQQFYCEQRLHYQYLKGGVNLEIRESIARRIVSMVLGVSRKPKVTGWLRIPLISVIDDVPLISAPDALLVEDTRVKLIVKASTITISKAKPRIYEGDKALAYLHMLLLDELGFNLNSTRYYIVKGPSEEVFKALIELRNNGKILNTYDNLSIYVLAHDEDYSRKIISWALAYWKKLRPPKPNPSKHKCTHCTYKNFCPYAIR